MSKETKGCSPERRRKQAENCRKTRPERFATGPKTPAGKAKSAQNALKHGFHTPQIRRLKRLLRLQKLYVECIKETAINTSLRGGARPNKTIPSISQQTNTTHIKPRAKAAIHHPQSTSRDRLRHFIRNDEKENVIPAAGEANKPHSKTVIPAACAAGSNSGDPEKANSAAIDTKQKNYSPPRKAQRICALTRQSKRGARNVFLYVSTARLQTNAVSVQIIKQPALNERYIAIPIIN